MKTIAIIHGPNLNLLGTRRPEIYGSKTLEDLNQLIQSFLKEKGIEGRIFQSNWEGAIIDFLHEIRSEVDGIVINPGALTHYSYSLRDAIEAIEIPCVEVHLSDIHQREEFRKISVVKDVCIDQISGFGFDSYLMGLNIILSAIAGP